MTRPDGKVRAEVLFVQHSGTPWEMLPQDRGARLDPIDWAYLRLATTLINVQLVGFRQAL